MRCTDRPMCARVHTHACRRVHTKTDKKLLAIYRLVLRAVDRVFCLFFQEKSRCRVILIIFVIAMTRDSRHRACVSNDVGYYYFSFYFFNICALFVRFVNIPKHKTCRCRRIEELREPKRC